MTTLIDLFILLSLAVGALVIVSAALFGLIMLIALLIDLFNPDPEWDYEWDPPFNVEDQ